MHISDIMISDTSSVINEFLALNKFGIIYVLPYEQLNHSDGMPVLSIDPEDWLKGAFPHMHKPEDLLPAVHEALHPTEVMKTKLAEYRDYFFSGLDGNAGQRVKNEIERLLAKTEKSDLKTNG
jgi:CDP-glycerol glycerophosphotransferase (TagB/SpsB family)